MLRGDRSVGASCSDIGNYMCVSFSIAHIDHGVTPGASFFSKLGVPRKSTSLVTPTMVSFVRISTDLVEEICQHLVALSTAKSLTWGGGGGN